MTQESGWQKLQKIYALFGPRTVLLPIHLGTKKCFRQGWQSVTWEITQQPHYQAELANGGIAVLFGPENLAGLDCDNDSAVERFLHLNPWAAETTRTRGARGCTFHFKFRGAYPKSLHKFNCGEWRGANGYTVISGIHPETRKPYKILVEKTPLEPEWSQIKWPPEWNLPWQQKTSETNNNTTPGTHPTGDLSRRILTYLAGCPGAVSGNGGHIQTLKVATQLVVGFALGVDGAIPYLREYNKKCEPPWSEKELLHKAQEAEKNRLGREVGAKIHDARDSSHVSPPRDLREMMVNTRSSGRKPEQIPQITQGVILKMHRFHPIRFWPIITTMPSPRPKAPTATSSGQFCRLQLRC